MKTTTAPTAAPAAPIRKLNLGALAKPAAKSKTEYPVLPDPSGDVSKLVADIRAETEQLDALTGSLDAKKAELRRCAADHYFHTLSGRSDIPSSIAARDADGAEVLISFQNRYKALPDETPVAEILGPERTARFFRQKFELKVDGDKVPGDRAEAMLADLQAVFEQHGCLDALSAKSVIAPTADFHVGRHAACTAEENLALDLACPIVAMVKTKGRKAA